MKIAWATIREWENIENFLASDAVQICEINIYGIGLGV